MSKFSPPVADEDRVAMGIPNYKTRSNHIEVTEMVDFVFELRYIRELLVKYWVKGSSSKAQPEGYDGAVFIWEILDEPPARPEDLRNHKIASRTPFVMKFDETERGKTVYVAAAWQNRRGNMDPYSKVQSALIP